MTMTLISGFHGTFADCVENIKDQGFTSQRNPAHWLGQGVYFYKDDYDSALMWARGQKRNKKECSARIPAVIKVVIAVEQSLIADLNIRSEQRKLADFIQRLASADSPRKIIFNKSAERINACAIYDAYTEEYGIKVILKTFCHLSPKLESFNVSFQANLGIYYSEQQICVKDTAFITGIECVYCDKPKIGTEGYKKPPLKHFGSATRWRDN